MTSSDTMNSAVSEGTAKVYFTTCGKQAHLIGVGICGQKVWQVCENHAPKDSHDGWRLCREEDGTLISFGKSGITYKIGGSNSSQH